MPEFISRSVAKRLKVQRPEFDFPAAIMGLAEADGPCACEQDAKREGLSVVKHKVCDGTGRIVPFASLRVECPCFGTKTICNKCFAHYDHNPNGVRHHGDWCTYCGGRNWVPEPDVRVACWEIMEWASSKGPTFLFDFLAAITNRVNLEHLPIKEAVIRAAQQYLAEHHSHEN